MSDVDNDYINYSQQDIKKEASERKLISSLKNGWNIIVALVVIGAFLVSSYEDFQDNELFFQSGLSCLDSKNLIIETGNSEIDTYKPLKAKGQILLDEYNNYIDYRNNNQEYQTLSSYEQLQVHNEIIPNHKNNMYIEEVYTLKEEYINLLNSKQANFETSNLHEKSHNYALATQDHFTVMVLYVNEFEKRLSEILTYIDIIEEYYFEWDLATTKTEKDGVEELYVKRLNEKVEVIDTLTDSIDDYYLLEAEKLQEIREVEYENMNLDKCNNEE